MKVTDGTHRNPRDREFCFDLFNFKTRRLSLRQPIFERGKSFRGFARLFRGLKSREQRAHCLLLRLRGVCLRFCLLYRIHQLAASVDSLIALLFGPLVGAMVWLYLSDFLQTTLHLGSTWKLVLGIVFVLLVCFLRHGLIGGIADLYRIVTRGQARSTEEAADETLREEHNATPQTVSKPAVTPVPARTREASLNGRPILQAKGLTKRYGGLVANSDIDFAVTRGEIRGIIGPNGAGKTTFFKMLTCEVPPTSGQILFEGHDITGMTVTEVCQLGLTKSYQINQLFNRLTVRENLTIGVLAELRGTFRLDLFRSTKSVPELERRVEHALELVDLVKRADTPVSDLAYGKKRRLEIGLALATSPTLLLLDEPLAGMSPQERIGTVRLLKSIARGRTMIIIDHDMDSLFELVERVTVLHEGRILIEGTPDEIKRNSKVQEAYLGGVHAEVAAE